MNLFAAARGRGLTKHPVHCGLSVVRRRDMPCFMQGICGWD